MVFYLFLISTFVLVTSMFLTIYIIIKYKTLIQGYQQSVYDTKRYINYIKENYKYTFGINELLPIIFLSFTNIYSSDSTLYVKNIILYLLAILFIYYNLKFYNIAKKRYQEKLPLKYTWRVKRLIITSVIIILISLLILLPLLKYKIFITIIILIYTLPINILISGIINTPIENHIKKKFKKTAINKLKDLKNLTVIGITGSYGKTSIKNIINDILKEEEITLQTPSSFNTPMGLTITINNDLNKMHENFIAEMGAYYKGEIKELAQMVSPKIGIVSSIGPQHLETFKTIENVQNTKMELIENLPADGLGILNYDNKYIRDYKIKNKVPIKWYSLENENVDLYAYNIKYLKNGMEFTIKYKEKEYEIKTKLLGKHNIYNILAAILVADYKGIPIEKTINNIKKVSKIPNRLELKNISEELTIIDDSFNGNIEGMQEGINILSKFDNIRILITPGIIDGGKKNFEINKKLAITIKNIDYIYIVGNYNKKALLEGLKNNKSIEIHTEDNFIDAYNLAVNIKGSKTILIANDLPDKYNK